MDWPILYKQVLKVKDLNSPLGVATMWTEREVVGRILADENYCVIGNLYSAAGISAIIRNIYAKPTIRKIILWGADLSRSGQAFLGFMKNGVDSDYYIIGDEKRGMIEKEIPKKYLDLFRQSVEVVNLPGKPVNELKKVCKILDDRRKFSPFSAVRRFPTSRSKPFTFPSEQVGFRVWGKTTAQVWLKILNNIIRYGRLKKTRYTQENELKELLNLTAVIYEEDINNPYLPHYFPFSQKDLKIYYPQVLSAKKIPGVSYTYGQRLREHHGIDQVEEIIKLIKRRPFSKKMAAFTADVGNDWSADNIDRGDTPCLTQVLCSIQDNKLFMTTHFRSQDMVHGWPRNVFSLIKLQDLIAKETGYPKGAFCLITHSAHIYSDDYKLVEKILKENYQKELMFAPQEHFEEDPRGNLVVEIRNPKSEIRNKPEGEIVVRLYAPSGGLLLKEWRGKTAKEIYWQITDWDYLVLPSHLVYLGTELQKAEEALKSGRPYTQDRA